MDEVLSTLPRPARRCVRALLKALAVALLPFARAADYAADLLTRRFPRLGPWQWHIAMAVTTLAVSVAAQTGARLPSAVRPLHAWYGNLAQTDVVVLDLHIEITHSCTSAAIGAVQALVALHTSVAVLLSATLRLVLQWPVLSATCVLLMGLSIC